MHGGTIRFAQRSRGAVAVSFALAEWARRWSSSRMDAVSSRAGAQLGGRHERRDEDRPTLSRALLAGRVLATPGVVWLATAPIPGHHPLAWPIGRPPPHECGWRLLHPPHGGRGDGERRDAGRGHNAGRHAAAPRRA